MGPRRHGRRRREGVTPEEASEHVRAVLETLRDSVGGVLRRARPRGGTTRSPTRGRRGDNGPDRNFDASLALAGGAALERCIDLVRAGGRVACPNGVEPEPRRRRNVRVVGYDAIAGPREFARLSSAVEDAHLRVPIAATYPLAGAARAHERLEQGHVIGRIALRVRRAT